MAIEQINQTLDELASDDWLEDIRYIPSFSHRPGYINLIVRQLEKNIRPDVTENFLHSRIGIVLETHGGPEKSQGQGLAQGYLDDL